MKHRKIVRGGYDITKIKQWCWVMVKVHQIGFSRYSWRAKPICCSGLNENWRRGRGGDGSWRPLLPVVIRLQQNGVTVKSIHGLQVFKQAVYVASGAAASDAASITMFLRSAMILIIR